MQIFNQTINIFIANWQEFINQTLLNNKCNQIKCTLRLIENDKQLGVCKYLSKNEYLILLNKKFLYISNKKSIRKILYHEIAHALDHHLNNKMSHSKTFNDLCRFLNCPDAIGAYSDIETEIKFIKENSKESVVEKIQKLLSLSNSDNENEAKLAIQKANLLIQKHNLDYLENGSANNIENIYQSIVHISEKKSVDYYIKLMINILEKNNVFVLLNRTRSNYRIEVSGEKENVEIAQYIWDYLYNYLETNYSKLKKIHKWKGISPKNNYYRGFLEALLSKLNEEYSNKDQSFQNSLVLYNQKIKTTVKDIIYSDIKIRTRSNKNMMKKHDAYNKGKEMGKEFSLNKAINKKTKIKLLN